jgi:hypothetical protein
LIELQAGPIERDGCATSIFPTLDGVSPFIALVSTTDEMSQQAREQRLFTLSETQVLQNNSYDQISDLDTR